MPRKVWDEITYPFANFNGGAPEVLEWIINSKFSSFIVFILVHTYDFEIQQDHLTTISEISNDLKL